ncbi:MAG: fhlA [Candidatus Solibacter sp.]|nr:fhlA [Candidatus Solibacter sp.]
MAISAGSTSWVCSEDQLVGESRNLQDVIQRAAIVGPTGATVLILGETGTGKGKIASTIHEMSGRRQHPFVKVNCAAIPLGLLESELFGHERGAFTGAISQRLGRFELASRGTLFLDEIGDIPAELQPKLLRVLQEHEFERLGSTQTIRTDARLIAATHQDLPHMMSSGRFRTDLFYRLNVFPITVPPLRERRDDIPLLTKHFVKLFSDEMNKKVEVIPQKTIDAMCRYPWPGNIRELENFLERAVILSQGAVLEAPLYELTKMTESTAEPVTLKDAERAHILRTLRATNGVIATAAARLGLPRSTLFYKMRRLGISVAREENHPVQTLDALNN